MYATAVVAQNGSITSTGGKVALTCNKTTTGVYPLSWTAAPSSPFAFIQLRAIAGNFTSGYQSMTTTGCTVNTWLGTTLTDNGFNILVFV